MTDKTSFFEPDEDVPHIDAVDSALNRNFCVAQSWRRRNDRKNAPLVRRNLPFFKLRQKDCDIDLMKSAGKEAGTTPKDPIFLESVSKVMKPVRSGVRGA